MPAAANPLKRVLFTGGTRGIGRSAAFQLVQQGFEVVVTTRNAQKAEEMILEVDPPNRQLLSHVVLHLETIQGVQEDLPAILNLHQTQPFDIVVLNAGVMFPSATPAPVEPTFMVNYLGHAMLANELVRTRPPGHPIHFVGVSSILTKYCIWPLMAFPASEAEMWTAFGPRRSSSGFTEYAFSKAALTFLCQQLMQQPNITASPVNPGNTATEISANMPRWQKMLLGFFFRHTLIAVEEAARRVVVAAVKQVDATKWLDGGAEVSLPQHLVNEKTRFTLAEFTENILSTQDDVSRR